MSDAKEINYKSIPVPNKGHIALTIYPPGTFFGKDRYAVMVGGCGIGREKTLAEAEKLLECSARAELERRITEHVRLAKSYRKQLGRFKLEKAK